MVTLKVDSTGVDVNKKSGFEPYEGPLPTPGAYAVEIKSVRIRISQAGNPYFNVLFEFANQQTPEKQAFKGYPLFEKIVPGDSDIQKERVGKFVNAICGRLKANVDHDEVTDGGTVNKIGGKDPVGTRLRLVVRRGSYNGEPIIEMMDLFPWPKDQDWPEGPAEGEDDSDVEVEPEEEAEDEDESNEEEPEDDEAEEGDEEEGDEPEEEDDGEYEARVAELGEMDRAAVKVILKGLDSEFKVLKRHTDDDLRQAVLGLEFDLGDAEEGDEPPF